MIMIWRLLPKVLAELSLEAHFIALDADLFPEKQVFMLVTSTKVIAEFPKIFVMLRENMTFCGANGQVPKDVPDLLGKKMVARLTGKCPISPG